MGGGVYGVGGVGFSHDLRQMREKFPIMCALPFGNVTVNMSVRGSLNGSGAPPRPLPARMHPPLHPPTPNPLSRSDET